MALALHGSSTSGTLNQGGGTSFSFTTASFSPPADSWIYLQFGVNNTSSVSQTVTPTTPTNTGTALTWELVDTQYTANGSVGGGVVVYRAYNASAQTGITVTSGATVSGATFNTASPSTGYVLDVWTGAAASQTTAAKQKGLSTTTNDTRSITTTQDNSAIIYFAEDWNQAGTPTSSSGTMGGAWNIAGQTSGGRVYRVVGAAGSNSENFTYAGTPSGNFIQYEILEATGPAATVDQQAFRFGADDGSESAHTWLAAQNASIYRALGSSFLLRALLQATGDPATAAYTLRAQKNGSGGYVAVPVGAGNVEAYSQPTWGAAGTAASGTTSCTPAYPTGISASTSKLFCLVTGRSNTANTVPTMPSGWTRIGGLEGGTGTWGVDLGTRSVDFFQKDTVDGTESGTVTVSLSGSTANTLRATIFRVEVTSGYGVDVELVSGADTSNDTSYSATASANATFDSNRLVLIGTAQNVDTGTASSRAISASGITFGTLTNRADTAVTNGNDHRHILNSVPVSSGSGTVAPTFSYTISASGSGPTAFLVLRGRLPAVTNELYVEASSNIAAGGEATTQRLTGGTGSFTTGRRWDDENGTDTIDLTLDDFTEVEWSLNTQSPAANGDYWDFRVYAGATALTNYDVTPRLTLGSSGTQALEGGAVGGGTASGNLGVGKPIAGAATGAGTATGDLSAGAAAFPAGARAALVGDDPDLAYAYAEIERAVEIYLPMYRAATGGTQALAGNALAASLATGALSVAKALAGSAAGAATATGALGVAKPIAGSATGSGTATGALAVIKPLAGAATGAGSAEGLLAIVKSLAGSATGANSAAGDLSQQGQVDLLGAAIAQGTATGELAHGVPLTATAVAASVVTGNIGVAKPLAGAAQGAGQASGALVLGIGLQAAAVGAAIAAGTLSTQGQVDLAGSAQGAGAAAGVLTLTVRLAGSATAAGSASGALASAGVDLAGNAQGRGQAAAVLELQIPLTGAAIAQAQAQGGLALAVRLTGEAIAAAVATGRLSVNGDAIELSGAALASAQAAGVLQVAGLAGSTAGFALLLQRLTVRLGPAQMTAPPARIGGTALRRRY